MQTSLGKKPRQLSGPKMIVIAAILALAILDFLAKPAPVLVLAYHRVTRGPFGPVPHVTPAVFARQLDYLKKAGYGSITPDDLDVYLNGEKPLPPRAVLFTFDDGWVDNYIQALPLMRAHGFTATVFVISGKIGKPGYMTATQLRALVRAGWTIGAHTVTHPHLPSLDPPVAEREIAASKKTLARLVGRPITAFSYPYGDLNASVRRMAGDAGLRTCFSSCQGLPRAGQDPWAIKRLTMPRRGGLALLYFATASWLSPLRRTTDWIAGTSPVIKAEVAYSRHLWHPQPPSPHLPRKM